MKDIAGKIILRDRFFKVPNNIFDINYQVVDSRTGEKRSLKTAEKLIYIYLCRCGNEGGTAFPSYKTIADKCGCSRDMAIKSVRVLLENGLIKKTTRIKEYCENYPNIYEVMYDETI